MKSFGVISLFMALVVVFVNCKKSKDHNAPELYGVWVKGPNFGDTLWFMNKNGHNIMRINESFNPVVPAYAEKEYQFNDGKLRLQRFAPSSTEFYDIDSFTWTQQGTEFKVQGMQLFMFMSSSITYFTYHKL